MTASHAMDDGENPPTDDLSCQEFVALVSDYLEDAMDQPTRARFERHLLDCPDCPVYLQQMRAIVGATGMLREEDVSPEVRDVLLSRFRTWHNGH